MCRLESLIVKLLRRLRGFPCRYCLTPVADCLSVTEAELDSVLKRRLLLIKCSYLFLDLFQALIRFKDFIAYLNDLSVRVAVELDENVLNGSRFGFFLPLNVVNPEAVNLFTEPCEEVRNEAQVLIAELTP